MSFTEIERVWQLPLESRKKLILLYILLRGVCHAKTSTQIEETGICKSDFYELRRELLKEGYIEKLDRDDPRVPETAPEECDQIYRACPERWDEAARKKHSARAERSAIAERPFRQDGICFPPGRNAYKEERHINNTGTKTPGAARSTDPAFEHFTEEFKRRNGAPYQHKQGDFVQLAKLRTTYDIDSRASPPDFAVAVANYFDSQKGFYTLADLCTGYATYRQHAVDRFKQPIGGSNYATSRFSGQDTRQQRNIADAHELLASMFGGNSGSN